MTQDLLLTEAERERFASYLERDAVSTDGVADQMERVGVPSVLVKKMRAEATASRVVAAKLRSIYDDSVAGGWK